MKNKHNYILLIFVLLIFCNTKTHSQNSTYAMNELSEKLVTIESGIWSTKRAAKSDSLYYYVLQLSKKDNRVIFSYNTREEDTAHWNWVANVLRYGTFEINGNILTLNFTSVKGSSVNKPNFSDEPLPEILCVKIEVEDIEENKIIVKEQRGKLFHLENPGYILKDIEITEYKLILKQISGKNIFEHHAENTKIELVADRPIID